MHESLAGGLRVELDDRSESIGRKIRDAELRRSRYMLVVGEREQREGAVAVREHRAGDTGAFGGGVAQRRRTRGPAPRNVAGYARRCIVLAAGLGTV